MDIFVSGGLNFYKPYSTLSTSSLRASINRPVRHLRPLPGFSSVRPKQINELSSGLCQNPLNYDYSLLDGYQLQSSMKGEYAQSTNQSALSSHYINGSMGTTGFPFPGKQVPALQFEDEKQNS